MFYQHKNLHHPGHGAEEFRRKRTIREFRDYGQWIKGNFVPTESKLRAMQESGFSFPEEVKTLDKPMDAGLPTDERIRRLSPALEKLVLRNIGQSLFKEDLLLFGMFLAWPKI